MKVEFEGLEELIRALEKVEGNTEKGKKEALEAGANVMQKAAVAQAPIRKVNGGTLKANIEISDIENDEIQVYVDNQGPAYYGYMLEFGTKKMRAYPFMGPAFMKSRFQIQVEMANAIRKRLMQ